MQKYSINIMWSDEDNGFIATIPEFKNLSAFGETYDEALKEAKVVVEGYIKTLKSEGMPIPDNYKISNYSGQTRLRLPQYLHQLLALEAERQGVSLNTYMVSLLSMNYGICRCLDLPNKGALLILIKNPTEQETIGFEPKTVFRAASDSPIIPELSYRGRF